MKCPECGTEIADNVAVCPSCGYEIVQSEVETVVDNTNTIATEPVYKNKKYIGIAFGVAACIMLIIALTRINNDTYSFYKQHYKECMEGYAENSVDARNSGALFSGTYRYIASEYETMAKNAHKKIWKYRIEAIVLCLGGVTCGIIGYKFIKWEKENGISKVS